VKNGKAIASAKQVNWLRLIVASSPDTSQGFMQHSPAVVSSTFPQPCGKLHVICGKRGYFGVSPRDLIRWKDCRRKGSQRLTRQAGR
jgi:hypothetical protein